MKTLIALMIYSLSVVTVYAQQPLTKISWYKSMTGRVDKLPVTMYLHRAGNRVYGYYYFNSSIQPQYVSGSANADRIIFDKFEGTLIKNIFKGYYTSGPKARQVAFQVSESFDKSLNNFDFDYLDSEKSQVTNSGKNVDFSIASIWPKNTLIPGTQFYLKTLIAEQFNIREFTDKVSTIFGNRQELFYSARKDKEGLGSNVNEQRVLVCYQDKKLLSIANVTHDYTSDSGPYYAITYSAVDLLHQRILPLIDVLGTQGIDKLPPLLEKYFRKKYLASRTSNLKSSGLFESDIQPNDNFYLTPSGICFSYIPGELGAVSMGQIDIFIPFSELNSYLTPLVNALIK